VLSDDVLCCVVLCRAVLCRGANDADWRFCVLKSVAFRKDHRQAHGLQQALLGQLVRPPDASIPDLLLLHVGSQLPRNP
jgi:hypothetical protein